MYSHTNKINGKVYIGITSQCPAVRWGTDGCNYHDSPKFWNAIQKYGWSNFEHRVIKDGLTQDEARKLEIETIQELDTIKCGYNISPGGDVPPVLFGSTNPNYHKTFSEETRMKMSLNHADVTGGKNPVARPVMCIETQEEFATITAAAKSLNVTRNAIAACCNGRAHTCKGYHWKYVDPDS